jgi:hypothetical protein
MCAYAYAKLGDTPIKALKYTPISGAWEYTTDGSTWQSVAANATVTLCYRAIFKIVDTNPDNGIEVGTTGIYEHIFATLNAALSYARDGFDNGNPMSATNPVAIEMVADYEMEDSDHVTLSGDTDNVILKTADTTGGVFNYSPTFGTEEGRLS